MDLILGGILFFVGALVCSFTLIPVLIILKFGIPFTKKLEEQGVLNKNNGFIKRYFTSLILLTTAFIVIAIVISNFIPNGLLSLLLGCGLALILGIGQFGENKNNISDYMTTNQKYLNKDTVEKLYNQSKRT